jgi:hypothetical protein
MIEIIIIYYKKILKIIIWLLMGVPASDQVGLIKLFVFEKSLIFGLDSKTQFSGKTRREFLFSFG